MNLVSFQLSDTVLWIYRKGNEKVWDIDLSDINESAGKIAQMVWRSDGNLFAITTDDHVIAQYDTKRGHLVRCLKLQKHLKFSVWNQRISPVNIKKTGKMIQNVSIAAALPVLQHLNPHNICTGNHGKPTDSYDTEYTNDDALDMILSVMGDNTFCCIFGGIFVVEDLQCPQLKSNDVELIFSKPDLEAHVCLTSNPNRNGELSLIQLGTPFLKEYNGLPSTLMICTRLMGLIDHFKVIVAQIDNQYKPYINYTVRIVELLRGEIKDDGEADTNNETENGLSENGRSKTSDSANTDPVYDLYDLLLTGSLSNATKKWLTEYLSDRGIKRWSKLGLTYFESARDTIFNDTITALHHMLVALTDLRGLILSSPETLSTYGAYVDECIQISQNYLRYAHKLIIELNEEERYFDQTIRWLSSILNEITSDEKSNESFKTNDITKYLVFVSSKLNYVAASIDDGENSRENMESNSMGHSRLNDFTKVLDTVLGNLFTKMRDEIKRNITISNLIELPSMGTKDADTRKVHMDCFEIHQKDHYFIYHVSGREVQMCVLECDQLKTYQTAVLEPEVDDRIVDAIMIDSAHIMILFEYSLRTFVLDIETGKLRFVSHTPFNFTHLADGSIFHAESIALNNKRDMCCILDKSRKKYCWWPIRV